MFLSLKTIKDILIVFLLSAFTFLFFDFLFGKMILEKFYWRDEETFRESHAVYHHTLKKYAPYLKPNHRNTSYYIQSI